MNWQSYALMTVLSWGVYGVLLHMGRGFMPGVTPPGPEGAHAGLKAFLLVGVAYFVVAVVGPLIVLKMRGSDWSFTSAGITWSFIAGAAGAIGAFTLVLALGSAGAIYKAAAAGAVMPIVFGGAPVVNTIVTMIKAPPAGGLKALPLPFILGVLLAATGGFMVAKFAPAAGAKHGPAPTPAPAAGSGAAPSGSSSH